MLQVYLTAQEMHKIEESVAQEERLLHKQNIIEEELIELTRLAVIKVRSSYFYVTDI